MSRMRSRTRSAARRTALPPMNVPREANVPVQTADESVFELSIVTQSYGTPSASATICVCTVFDPCPMSTVPEKTSTRPSGFSLIQAWIKLKPDRRVDVFSGTVDIGQGSKTVQTQIVADALGVPYDWVTMDNSNTDSSAVCTGTFASRGTFIGGNAVRLAAERVRERILNIASKELEIDASDLEISDGEGTAKGAPQKKISVSDVAGAAPYNYGELVSGSRTPPTPLPRGRQAPR